MIMRINEYGRTILILGFKEVKVDDKNEFLKRIRQSLAPTPVQLFDAENVAGRKHLFFAALNALKAFAQKQNISESIEVESLLYVSCQRQISRAVEMVGLKNETTEIAVLVFPSNEKESREAEEKASRAIAAVRDEEVLEARSEKKAKKLIKTFGITELELETLKRDEADAGEALTRAVVERGALLATRS